MSSKTQKDGTEIHEEVRARNQAVVQAGVVIGLAATTVIDNPYGCGDRVILYWVVWDVVSGTTLAGLCYQLNESSVQLLLQDAVMYL